MGAGNQRTVEAARRQALRRSQRAARLAGGKALKELNRLDVLHALGEAFAFLPVLTESGRPGRHAAERDRRRRDGRDWL
jgi:hypothetical protein